MRRSLLTCGLFCAAAAGFAWATVTVPDGGCTVVAKSKPPLPAPERGAPGANEWNDGPPPIAAEDDLGPNGEYGFSDDFMGHATELGHGMAGIRVCNSGGDLFGPNGGDQNGLGEGDCIEVKICWPYCKWVKETIALPTFDPPGFVFVDVWTTVRAYACSEPCEVCPG